jgi:hypothetical protein
LTSALEGGGWSAPRPGSFTPGKDPVPIVQEARWAPGPVWTCAKNLAPTGIRSPDRPARSQSVEINIPVYFVNCNWVDSRWQYYSTHLHTNNTQNSENGTYIKIKKFYRLIWEVRAVPRLCELYAGICLTTEEKARKNLSQGSRKLPRYPGGSCPVHIYAQAVHRTQ